VVRHSPFFLSSTTLTYSFYSRDSEEDAPAEYPPDQPEADLEDDGAAYGAEEAELEAALVRELEEAERDVPKGGDHEMEGAEETVGKDDEEEDISDAESEDIEDESDDEEDDLDDEEGGDRDEDVDMGDDTESKDTNTASGHHQHQDIMVH
jgi:histone chaperone ASF1